MRQKMRHLPKLWGERFQKELHGAAKAFSYSLETDAALLGTDIKVSMAHVLMLAEAELISKADSKRMIQGLWQVLKTLKRKPPAEYAGSVEDIHTWVQTELEKKIGVLAGKLHTGRSRNDLVATSLRLYAKDKLLDLNEQLIRFQQSLLGLAERCGGIVIPGYTHLQRAQVVLLAHHVLAYIEMLARDASRLENAKQRLDECPLGAGALAGSSLPLDRFYTAKLLGFQKPSANSMDAVSDRDFVIEIIAALSILQVHLSRFSEDVILWSTSEFGFVTLSDQFSTGSSLMPQKKNPDMLELVRGRTGQTAGHLMSVLMMMKGLPLSYNRDMQEDKKPLFQSMALAAASLEVLAGVTQTLDVDQKACERAVNDSFLYATDLVDYLVRRKVSFKNAHEIVGQLVGEALESHCRLSGLSFEVYLKYSGKFKKDVFDLFDPYVSISNKVTFGSPNPEQVKKQLAVWKQNLKNQSAKIKKAKSKHA